MRALQPPTLAQLVLWSLVAIGGLWTLSRPVATNDLHIFLATGRWMADHGEILRTEVFTWSASGVPYDNPTWGFSWASWAVYQGAGLQGIRLVHAALTTLTLALTGLAIRAEGRSHLAAAVGVFWTFALLFGNLAVRGQSWAFPLFPAAILVAAIPGRAGLKLLGGLALGALWSNLHGSFIVGVVWMAIAGAAHSLTQRSLRAGLPHWSLGLGLAAGSLLNPEGLAAWGFVLDNSATPVERGFSEWFPPTLRDFQGQRFYGSLALWAAACLFRRPDLRSIGLLLAFGVLACTGTRFVAFYGLALAPAVGHWVDRASQPSSPQPLLGRRGMWALGAALCTLYAGLALRTLREPPSLHEDTPVALADALQAHCGTCTGQRIFNPPEYGGYLSFRFPGLLTSGDIRAWVFPDSAWSLYTGISEAPEGWDEQLRAHGVGLVHLHAPFHADTLMPAIRASEDWLVLYEDEMALLAVRSPGE